MARGRRQSEYATRDLTQGSVPRTIWFLGWPQMVSGAASTIDEVSDLFWAGFIGATSLASVGVGQTWISFFNTARMGLDTSARAMISRAVGAGDLRQANHVAYQSLLINTVVTGLLLTIGFIASEFLWNLLGVAETLSEEGLAYQRVRFVASFFFGANAVTGSLLMAGGDSMTPMRAQLVARGVHIVLSPAIIFGFGPIPALGIAGGGITYGIGHTIGLVMNFHALASGSSRLHLTFEGLNIDLRLALRQFRIGAPASVTSGERSFSQLILTGIVAPFGPTGLAVFSVIQRLQGLTSFAGSGLAQAAGVIVGQSLGAQNPERARATVWWGMACVGGLQATACILMFLFPEAFVHAFTRDPAVIEFAVPWLRIAVTGILLLGAANVLASSLNTAGDTRAPMFSGLGSLWLVQQPVAVTLTGAWERWTPLGLQIGTAEAWNIGLLGVAWAIVIASVVRFLSMFLYFLWGPWWKTEVLLHPAPATKPAVATSEALR